MDTAATTRRPPGVDIEIGEMMGWRALRRQRRVGVVSKTRWQNGGTMLGEDLAHDLELRKVGVVE